MVEDFDSTLIAYSERLLRCPTTDAQASAIFQKMIAAQDRLMAARSGELALIWGRSLYRRLRAQGLVNVGMEGYLALREGRSPGADQTILPARVKHHLARFDTKHHQKRKDT